MKIVRSVNRMQKICLGLKKQKTIAVVPTMGFLHEGHLSLVKKAQKKARVVIVTVFVNPLQFGPKEDLKSYPRNEKKDIAKLKSLGVDYIFIPETSELYPQAFQTLVKVKEVTKFLCGKRRPGHFEGVTTVVLKLFQILQPDYAVFGKKDFQQLITIKTMVRDLHLPIKILSGPIVREENGLAMSSRNARLTPKERGLAASLYKGLKRVKRACRQGDLEVKDIKTEFLTGFPRVKNIKLDYLECMNAHDLTKIRKYKKGETLVAVAAFVGKTRLIDNIVI